MFPSFPLLWSMVRSASMVLLLAPACKPTTTPRPSRDLAATAEQLLSEKRGRLPEWGNPVLGFALPLYRPDVEGVAYYEFPVLDRPTGDPAGFIIVSTGPHDQRLVEWSTRGRTNASQLLDRSGRASLDGIRMFRLDVGAFVAEDSSGQVLARLGPELPVPLRRAEGEVWDSFVAVAARRRSEAAPEWRDSAPARITRCRTVEITWAGTHADQRRYAQVPPGVPPNVLSCWTGCGATAWAMLFGWVDWRASKGDPVWRGSWNMYGDRTLVAPDSMDGGVREMTWRISRAIGNECVDISGYEGLGRSWPWNMEKARQWLKRTTNTAPALTVSSTFGEPDATGSLRERAAESIRNGRPVVIALGWEHYALAYGYQKTECDRWPDKHEFFINAGHGGGPGYWTPARIWFVGEVFPYEHDTARVAPCPEGQHCCWVLQDGSCYRCISSGKRCVDDGIGSCSPMSGCGVNQKCCEKGEEGACRCAKCWPKDKDCP